MDEYEVVPWFSATEWMTVYELIFSEDVVELEDGYEKLRCWKARCNRLPAGIECTLIILEAILTEKRVKDNVFIIKSVYALAITRFLNHAASFDKEKMTASLYKIAESLNIPEWIVNLRHEAAHGPELPSLEVLRAGVHFALSWLRTAYWTKGIPLESTKLTTKVKIPELKTRLLILVEVYQELYRQEREGGYVIKNIKHPNLLKTMEELLDDDDYVPCRDGTDKNCLVNKKLPFSTDKYVFILIRKVYDILNLAQEENELNDIIEFFLEVSYFVPKEEVVDIFNSFEVSPSEDKVAVFLKRMWKKLLRDAIQKSGALPILLRKLVHFSNLDAFRQKWAAYWVKEISLGLRKATLIRREFMNGRGNIQNVDQLHLADDHISYEEQFEIEKKLRNSCSEYEDLIFKMTLSPNHLPDLKDLIEDVLYHPQSNSPIYIKELLDIYVKPLSHQQKRKLVKALNIYLMNKEYGNSLTPVKIFDLENKYGFSLTPAKIYDLEDVIALVNKIEKTKPVAEDSPISVQCPDSGSIMEISLLSSDLSSSLKSSPQQSPQSSISGCSSDDDSCDWEETPVGMLPWQENNNMLMEEEEVVYTPISED